MSTPYTVAVIGSASFDPLEAAVGDGGEVDWAIDDVGDLDPRRRWPNPARARAVVQLPGHEVDAVGDIASAAGATLEGILLVTRHDQFGRHEQLESSSPADGLTQISFVAPIEDIDEATFVARYREHRVVVAAQHPGVAHYRQDVIVDKIGCGPMLGDCLAVSQLWFADAPHYRTDYYAHTDSATIVRADIERFLDPRRTWSLLTTTRRRLAQVTDCER